MNWTFDDRELQRLLKELPQEIDQIIRATAFDVQGAATGLIQSQDAIDTGATLNSGFTKTCNGDTFGDASGKASELRPEAEMIDTTPGKPGLGTAYVSFATNYAIWIELGTSRMASRPFLGPATEMADEFFLKEAKKVLPQ